MESLHLLDEQSQDQHSSRKPFAVFSASRFHFLTTEDDSEESNSQWTYHFSKSQENSVNQVEANETQKERIEKYHHLPYSRQRSKPRAVIINDEGLFVEPQSNEHGSIINLWLK